MAVRYIHDILKMDVIVKASLMNEIRSEVQKGTLNADDFLTARFSIPNVWITTDVQLESELIRRITMTQITKTIIYQITIVTLCIFQNNFSYSQDFPAKTYSMESEFEYIANVTISTKGNLLVMNGHRYELFEDMGNSTSRSAKVLTMDTETGKINWIYDTKLSGSLSYTLHFSPDESKIMSGFFYGMLTILDMKTGELLHTVGSDEPYKPCGAVAVTGQMFTSDSLRFVTGVSCSQVSYLPSRNRVWNTSTGELDTELTKIFQEHIGYYPSPTMYDNVIISNTAVGSNSVIQLFDLVEKRIIHSFPGRWPTVSSNYRYVAYYRNTNDGVNVMDLETFQDISKVDIMIDNSNYDPMTVSNQGVLVLSGKFDYSRKVICPSTTGIVYEYPLAKDESENDTQIEFFPDGQRFLTVNGTDINIWDISKITTAVQDSNKY